MLSASPPETDIRKHRSYVSDGPTAEVTEWGKVEAVLLGDVNVHALLGSATRRNPILARRIEDTSLPLANRRRPLRRCRMILVVLGEDRLKGFLGPKFRRADFFQTGSVPI